MHFRSHGPPPGLQDLGWVCPQEQPDSEGPCACVCYLPPAFRLCSPPHWVAVGTGSRMGRLPRGWTPFAHVGRVFPVYRAPVLHPAAPHIQPSILSAAAPATPQPPPQGPSLCSPWLPWSCGRCWLANSCLRPYLHLKTTGSSLQHFPFSVALSQCGKSCTGEVSPQALQDSWTFPQLQVPHLNSMRHH